MARFLDLRKKVQPQVEVIYKTIVKAHPWYVELAKILLGVVIVGLIVWGISKADDTENMASTSQESSTTAEFVFLTSTSTSTETPDILASSTDTFVATTSDISTSTASTTESFFDSMIGAVMDVMDALTVTTDTLSPQITQTETDTDTGKLVTISASDEVLNIPLTDVLASTTIPHIFKVGEENKIHLKWKNNGNQNVSFHASDTDSDGYLDYIEWTVPHLSTQTFEIIFISKAFELDADKNIVADIYDTVATQDGNYAIVPDGNYVRFTFQSPVDHTKNIDIYAKPTDSTATATIEVYPVYTDADGNMTEGSKIATFPTINHEGTYHASMSNLGDPPTGGPTDVFDFKIIGSVDLDYVQDGPSAILFWTGAAGASIDVATNWSIIPDAACGDSTGGAVPGALDTAVFDSVCPNSALVDVAWNIAMLELGTGYTGTTTLNAVLTVSDSITLTAGTLDVSASGCVGSTSCAISLGGATGGDWINNGGAFNARTGTVTLTSTASGRGVTSGNSSFYNLIQSGVGGIYTLQDPLLITGTLALNAGTLDTNSTSSYALSAGVVNIAGGILAINGSNLTLTSTTGTLFTLSSGAFTSGTSTVIMNPDATVALTSGDFTGANAFYNLSLTPTITDNRTYTFGAGAIAINGDLNIIPTATGAVALTVNMGADITVAPTKNINVVGPATLDTTASNYSLSTGGMKVSSPNGMVTYNSGGTQVDIAYGTTVDSSNNVYVAGYQYNSTNGYDWAVRKYTSAGALDTAWGTGGMVTYNSGGANNDKAMSVTIDSNNNIYVAGYQQTNGYDWAVRKYTSAGALDTAWGTSGMVTYNSGGVQYDYAYAITIDSSNNIYVAGYIGTNGNDWAVRKYTSAGALDTSWGSGTGMVVYNSGASQYDIANAITIDSSNNIYVAGYIEPNGGDMAVRKYTVSGVLDTTWGTSGMVTYNSGGMQEDIAQTITIDSSNNVYVAGYIETNGGDWAVRKYTSAGALDTTWGTGGMVTYDSGNSQYDYAKAITIDSSNNVYVAGFIETNGNDWAVRKYTVSGVLDTTWGTSGMVTYNSARWQNDIAYAITIDSSNNIYVAGYVLTNGGDWAVRKYTSAGVLDTNTWRGGAVFTANNSTVTLTGTSGTLFALTGTFNAGGSTVIMNPDATTTLTDGIFTGSNAFYNLTLSPTITQARTYTFGGGALAINGDFNINSTAGSVLALTVNMGAAITVAPTKTTTITRTTSATSNLSTNTAKALSTGFLNIATGGTLTAGSATVTLTGTSGTLFTAAGTFTGGSSTVIMNPDAAVTLTSNNAITFYNLSLTPIITGNRTYTFGTSALTVSGDFTVQPVPTGAYTLAVNMGADITVASTNSVSIIGPATLNTTASNYSLSTGQIQVSNPAGMVTYNSGGMQEDIAQTITIDSSNNIYVAGYVSTNGSDWAVRKYTSAGALDTTWGTGGMVTYDSGASQYDIAYAITIDSSNNIYVAGQIGTNGGDMAVRKYTVSGVLDTTWGTSGMVTYDSGASQYDIANAITIDSSNNVYVAGYIETNGYDWAVRKYTSAGALDTTWGTGGMVTYDSGNSQYDIANAITIDSSNNIYVAGYIGTNGNDWAVRKYNSTGTLVTAWGISGMVMYNSGVSQHDYAYAITIDSSNNIYVAGQIGTNGGDMAVRKYNSAGVLVSGFGTNGMATYNSGDSNGDGANAITIDSSNNIYVAGYVSTNGGDMAVYKYTSAGVLDGTFSPGVATLTANNSTVTLTGTSGTLFTLTGVFNAGGSTVVMNPDAAVALTFGTFTGSNAFYNLTLSPTITQAQTYTFGAGAIAINGDFTINPTAASALALTVNMGAAITVAPTKTTTITRTTSATANLSTNTTNALSTGFLNIATGGTLTAGSATITLTGTSGTLFTKVGTFTPGTGTVVFSPDAAVTLTNNAAITFNNLSLTPTITQARTYTFGTSALTISGNFLIQPSAGTNLPLTVNLGAATTVGATKTTTISGTTSGTSNLDTTSAGHFALSTGLLSITAKGTLTANTSTLTLTGTAGTLFTLTAGGTFSGASSAVVVNGNGSVTLTSGTFTSSNAFNTLSFTPTITANRVYTFGAGAVAINGNFTVNPTSATAGYILTVSLGAGGLTVASNKTTTITGTTSGASVLDTTASNYAFSTGLLNTNSSGGMVTYDSIPGSFQADAAKAITRDSNNNIYVAGYIGSNGNDWAVRKYTSAGVLDATWGTSGMVTYNSGASQYDRAYAITIDSSNNIYVAGYIGTNGYDWAVRKYDSSGVIVSGWGTSGMVTYNSGASQQDLAFTITRDLNNNIYVAGQIGINGYDWAVRKYTSAGALDTTWGAGTGMVTYNSGASQADRAYAITVDSSNNIYVAGIIGTNDNDWAVRKYDSTGTLSTAWGTSGMVVYDTGSGSGIGIGTDIAYAITIDSSNSIYVAGSIATPGNDWAVRKYDSTGTLVSGWGTSGMVTYDSTAGGDTAYAITIDSSNNIYVAGFAATSSGIWAIRKYDSWGTLDNSFGTSGIVTYNAGGLGDYVLAITIDSNSNIYVADQTSSGGGDWAIRKYTSAGVLGTNWAAGLAANGSTITLTGTSGTLFTLTSGFNAGASTVVINPDAAVTLTSGIFTGSNAFYNLSLTPTITDNRTYTFGSGALAINGNFTINPTAGSALALTTNMGAPITVASGKTTTITKTTSATSNLSTGSNYALNTGNLTINAGGTLTANSSPIAVSNNWSNAGAFTAGGSTVTFNGTNQSLTGSTPFYNFSKTDTTNDSTDAILTFDNTATQTIGGLLTLQGTDGNDRVNLVSDSPGTRWGLAATGAFAINYADVTDSNASSGLLISPTNDTLGLNQNNLNWFFDSAPNAPTLVSPANASYTSDNTPTLSANYSDPDTVSVGTTSYRISSSSLVDCVAGTNIVASGISAVTSTNNQNTTWTPSSTIGSDATYYWCAQNDDGTFQSAWTGMGSFTLDTVGPAVGDTTLSGFSTFESYIKGTGTIIGGTATDTGGSGVDNTTCEYTTDGGVGWSSAGVVWNADHCEKTGVVISNATSYTFNTRVKDLATNQGTGTSTIAYTGDTIAPVTTDDSDTNWHADNQTITLTYGGRQRSDSGVAHTYSCVDTDKTCTPITEGTSVSVVCAPTNVCSQYVTYYSVDNLGNTEETKYSNLVKIDKQAPVTAGISSISVSSSTELTVVAETVTDSGAGLPASPYSFLETVRNTDSGWQASTTFIDTELTPNTQYIYKVRVRDSFDNTSDYSTTSSKYTLANAPGTPTLTVDSASQIAASWSANSNPEGTRYYIENITNTTNSGWIDDTTWTASGLTCNTAYTFEVMAKNGDDLETATSTASATTSVCPAQIPTSGGSFSVGSYLHPSPPLAGFLVQINNGAQVTDSRDVTLNLRGSFDTLRMSISNDPSFINAVQESYTIQKRWILTDGEGLKTVYVKFFSAYGVPSETLIAHINYQKPSFFNPFINLITPMEGIVGSVIEPIPPQPPIEQVVSAQAPKSLQNIWSLLPTQPIEDFVLQPVPQELRDLAGKFPGLSKTLEEVGIFKITDVNKLVGVNFVLPNISQVTGLATIDNLTVAAKEKIPTEIIFVKTGGGLVDNSTTLSLNEQGHPEQKMNVLVNQPIRLIVKPDSPAKAIKGYLIFKQNKAKQVVKANPSSKLTAALSQKIDVVQTEQPVDLKQTLVLKTFDFADSNNDGIWTADITAPAVDGQYEIITVIDYKNQRLQPKELHLVTVVDPEGYVYTETIEGLEGRVPEAKISLYWFNPETKEYGLWPAKNYQQINPQVTDNTGRYSFLVPEGTYHITAEAKGYVKYQSEDFEVKVENGIHINIELKSQNSWLRFVGWKAVALVLILGILSLLYYRYRYKAMKDRITRLEAQMQNAKDRL